MNNVLAAILACSTYVKQHSDPASPTHLVTARGLGYRLVS